MEMIPIALMVVLIVGMLFIGLPWLIFHHVTQWKKAATLTAEDENLLDALNDIARRLDERMLTVERIVTADSPDWRAIACEPAVADTELHGTENIRRIK